ncbi:MAG: BRCT domain-containing protein [Myxococcota bacterium]|jgi:hypothetical protein|nr:BRCT domain-containing protein [Myxococcota bacterium]
MSLYEVIDYDSWTESEDGIDELRRALGARDPAFPALFVQLAGGRDKQPEQPLPEGTPSLKGFLNELNARSFKKLTRVQRHALRRERIQQLEASQVPGALPVRFGLSAILMELWQSEGAFERAALLQIIRYVPLRWGPWRALKQIFKEAEAKRDLEVFGALTARFDMAYAAGVASHEIKRATLGYLLRRAWRFLRQQALALPASYADAACAVLRFYRGRFRGSWVVNHILFHESKGYTRRRFNYRRAPSSLTKHRAYAELWRRSPRPLFSLLERAEGEEVRAYATDALRGDFRTTLREIEPAWVTRLLAVHSNSIDEFVIWLLANVPRFEQAAFRDLGLHDATLSLFDSPSHKARDYAAAYARTHARDLPLERVLLLSNNARETVRKLARDLLRERDPRKEVGLDAWGRLLGSEHAHELATEMLRKHFGAGELSKDWFKDRLLSENEQIFEFASSQLGRVHSEKALGATFYRDLLDDPRLTENAVEFALDALSRLPVAELGTDFLQRTLVHPSCWERLADWVDEGRIKVAELGIDHLKMIAFHPMWEASAWVKELAASRPWAKELDFDEELSERVLGWLGDVRKFSPEQLGFDWLMLLVQRTEQRYYEFAIEYMIKAFLPADFAEKQEQAPANSAEPDEKPNVDLNGASFLFTGKMATMQRSAAEKLVIAANGANAAGVSPKLDYLVVGDDGSPLYGQGRKGSKQVKAEKLIASGSALKIISETAFLQMMAGEQREFSEDAVEAGCERLWEMATAPGPLEAPLARFALRYLRRHHLDIGLKMTDRHLDPGAEIPASFLTFERLRPLFADERRTLRSFALELAHYEFARWAPPMDEIVSLCELPYPEVRKFVTKALLADDTIEHRRYRVEPKNLTADAVYGFCESTDEETRKLGMLLIGRDPRLAIPEELFRLTESPDRQVRAFVVRTLWGLYRDRGLSPQWAPPAEQEQAKRPIDKKSKKAKASQPTEVSASAMPARPEQPPAGAEAMRDFMRRMLFSIPPAKLPSARGEGKAVRLRPLPARKAKLALVEVFRDLAMEDRDFASTIVPLLREFMASQGMSERDACLVAITRLHHAYPELAELAS